MQLQNPFPQRVRLLFLYVHACFNCGRSDRGLELHHIFGRETACAFNAIPLCRFCHDGVTHTWQERQHFFFLTFGFLHNERYRPEQDDYAHLEKHEWLVTNDAFKKKFPQFCASA